MDFALAKRKRRRFTLFLAVIGFAIAAFIWAYSEVTASSTPPFNMGLSATFIVLCPPSLLTVPLIDVEPGSIGFAITWLVVGILNSALYGLGGIVIGGARWELES